VRDPIDTTRQTPDIARPDRAALIAEIRRLERTHDAGMPARGADLGCAGLTGALPGGALALGRVHEVVGEARSEVRDAAVFGFACALLSKIGTKRGSKAGDGPVLWCARTANVLGGAPSARGLASLGLDPGRVIFADAPEEADRLWAMEEGLSVPGLAAVVVELDPARRGETTASRRLQLAAEKSGVTGLILRPRTALPSGAGDRVPVAVETRWRVRTAPTPFGRFDERPVWDVTLERARRGRPGRWTLVWDPVRGDLAEVRADQAADRSADPVAAPVPAPITPEVAA
jgi:protein ImuA